MVQLQLASDELYHCSESRKIVPSSAEETWRSRKLEWEEAAAIDNASYVIGWEDTSARFSQGVRAGPAASSRMSNGICLDMLERMPYRIAHG